VKLKGRERKGQNKEERGIERDLPPLPTEEGAAYVPQGVKAPAWFSRDNGDDVRGDSYLIQHPSLTLLYPPSISVCQALGAQRRMSYVTAVQNGSFSEVDIHGISLEFQR
jgi:hypothetical protein